MGMVSAEVGQKSYLGRCCQFFGRYVGSRKPPSFSQKVTALRMDEAAGGILGLGLRCRLYFRVCPGG